MDKFLNLLSICNKAGKLARGANEVLVALRSGKTKLIILASDASCNTKKQMQDKSTFYNVPLMIEREKTELGRVTGRDETAAVAVLDRGFAGELLMLAEEGEFV